MPCSKTPSSVDFFKETDLHEASDFIITRVDVTFCIFGVSFCLTFGRIWRKGTATEWIDFRKASAGFDGFVFGAVLAAVKDAAEGATAAGCDPMPQLLRSGFLDVIVELLHGFEAAKFVEDDPSGARVVVNANFSSCALDVIAWFYGVTWLLALLDFSSHPEAEAKLRTPKSAKALAYAMRHDVWQMGTCDLTTSPVRSQAIKKSTIALSFLRLIAGDPSGCA